jgi:acetolactate synthase small subunit
MLGEGGTEFSEFEAAARKFQARVVDLSEDDLKALRTIIDALKADLAALEAAEAVEAGGGDVK